MKKSVFLAFVFYAISFGAATVARADHHPWFGGQCGPVGSSSVLASMPVTQGQFPPTGPTYPEGIAILDGRVITTGPATFGTAGNGSPSQLTIFNRFTGALLSQTRVAGEDLNQEHALSEAATWLNFLYTPSTQLGVLRFRFPLDGSLPPVQQRYSTSFCSVSGAPPCTVQTNKCPQGMRGGLPALPNGIATTTLGGAYVADSFQGIIWYVPPAFDWQLPVTPEVFYCSPALQGSGMPALLPLSLFGANGIAVVGFDLYISVSFGPVDGTGLPTSVIYRLPRTASANTPLTPVYQYHPALVAPGVAVPPIADGVRLDPVTGHLFVVLGGQNQVSELNISTTPAQEVRRFSRTDPDHPFVNPSTIAVALDGTAYVTNHAITCCLPGDPNPACLCSGAQDLFGVIELCVR